MTRVSASEVAERMNVPIEDLVVEQGITPEEADELASRYDAATTTTAGGGSMAVAEPVATEAPVGAAWSGVIAQEGVDTGDGRRIEPGAVAWRELPLPLMAQLTDAHGGADPGPTVLAGRIDSISRDGENIVATGVFDTGENGAEAQRLVTDGMLRGISIDMAVNEAEFIPDEELPEDDLLGQLFAPGTLSITSGTILGATLVGFPAFENASIAIVAGAAMQLRHARSEGGHVVVTFAMPFAPTPPTPPKAPPKAPPAAAPPNLDDAMTAVENAVGKLRDAIDATGD